jgi:hypothetical protein
MDPAHPSPAATRLRRALFALSASLLLACGPLAAAPASAATTLTLSPNTIRAGFSIMIRATCSDNVNPAVVTSAAFGVVSLVPDQGVLASSATIPATTSSGTYNVRLACASGQTSTARLTVINETQTPNPQIGPATGGGEMAASGARLVLFGGLGAILVGLGCWAVVLFRRRTAAVR